ncbi:uncharacterized protein JOE11_003238 [Robbsia andropogonis]|uniref:HD domain-containing protein n=1 Tax=Robbsia andropogonis TaxID=28092 RepID=UPI003D1FCDF9
MKKTYLDKVRAQVLEDFDSTVVAHDMAHLLRVEHHARRIAEKEPVNMEVVRSAALLHDYHRFLEIKTGQHVSPCVADPLVRTVLSKAGAPDEDVELICRCVDFTERFTCAGDEIRDATIPREAMIVRDADMLDALGAVGIARAMMFGAKLGQPLSAADPVAGQFRHGKASSVIHHFHEKLLRLEPEFLTEVGAAEAKRRTHYMREYLSVLESELWYGSTEAA